MMISMNRVNDSQKRINQWLDQIEEGPRCEAKKGRGEFCARNLNRTEAKDEMIFLNRCRSPQSFRWSSDCRRSSCSPGHWL
jgi:hypothetical protein